MTNFDCIHQCICLDHIYSFIQSYSKVRHKIYFSLIKKDIALKTFSKFYWSCMNKKKSNKVARVVCFLKRLQKYCKSTFKHFIINIQQQSYFSKNLSISLAGQQYIENTIHSMTKILNLPKFVRHLSTAESPSFVLNHLS